MKPLDLEVPGTTEDAEIKTEGKILLKFIN